LQAGGKMGRVPAGFPNNSPLPFQSRLKGAALLALNWHGIDELLMETVVKG